jgi:hypothetical protein
VIVASRRIADPPVKQCRSKPGRGASFLLIVKVSIRG